MASIKNADDLCKHFNVDSEVKIKIYQLFNTHKEEFLKPCLGIFIGIKKQLEIILINEYEYPKGIFCVKTLNLEIIYKKENLQILDVIWKKL